VIRPTNADTHAKTPNKFLPTIGVSSRVNMGAIMWARIPRLTLRRAPNAIRAAGTASAWWFCAQCSN